MNEKKKILLTDVLDYSLKPYETCLHILHIISVAIIHLSSGNCIIHKTPLNRLIISTRLLIEFNRPIIVITVS